MTGKFAADPHCRICDGLGVRHTKAKRVGMHVRRDACPCTILGPLKNLPPAEHSLPTTYGESPIASMRRDLSELPPIKDLPMTSTITGSQCEAGAAAYDKFFDCQPRTPIDAPTRILGTVFKGNSDLNPTVRADVPNYRDCSICGGSGATRGHWCDGCKGSGKVAR